MTRFVLPRTRRATGETTELDLTPLLDRTLCFLESSPRGAARKDILAAMNLQQAVWPALRDAMERTGRVLAVGRGPGLRHVHVKHADAIPADVLQISVIGERVQQLEDARHVLRDHMRQEREIDSLQAQSVTGLKADPVRRLLLELVGQGQVERLGNKRNTRYRWVG